MKFKTSFRLGAVLFTGLFMSACSQQVQNEPMIESATTTTMAKGVAHTHPANECTNTISHTHPNGGVAHKHRYSCKPNKMAKAANAHTHPANKCTKTISHAHPNGKRKHAHRYSCQANNRANSANSNNGHYHPANSMTRSTRHSHPNGNRKHTHHYGG